jgi:N6-L-threonylcarbamoyladenine synthase
MIVLGIETSCDDTACAVVDGDGRVLSSVVSSQLAAHRPFGGVVPEIASREHLRNWPAVFEEALARAGVTVGDVDAVAATRGPGLVGALLVGLSLGKAIAFGRRVPFYGVHHLEGHVVSPFLGGELAPAEPPAAEFLALVVSGGHTTVFAARESGARPETRLETRDDAIGEAFDKFGKRLGLPYPQGPMVDELAERGRPRLELPVPAAGRPDFFSYSGLKTRAVQEIEALERRGGVPFELAAPPAEVLDLAASFRRAAVAQILDRLERLRREQPFQTLAVSGGVAANRLLRRELEAWAQRVGLRLLLVALRYSGDNAAMIAHAALLRRRRGDPGDGFDLEAESRIAI